MWATKSMSKLSYIPERGDIIWLSLDPRVGREQSGHRPALVISQSLLANKTGLILMCPITTKVKSLPFEILIKTPKTQGAILPIHVRSVDLVARQASFIEKAPATVLRQVLQSVKALME